jgi:hypothetical protein
VAIAAWERFGDYRDVPRSGDPFLADCGRERMGPGPAAGGACLRTLAAGRLVESLLYGLTPRDPVTLVGAPLVLLAVGVAATLPAARRATHVDPVAALREE